MRLVIPILLVAAGFAHAADRDRAVERGIRFIYSIAKNPAYFADDGEDLLWCLFSIAETSGDASVRALAEPMAREMAVQWVRLHPTLPAGAQPDDLVYFATGAYAANRLGVSTPGLKNRMASAAAKFSVEQFLQFDPRRGPPPASLPLNKRYDVWCDALLTAYAGQRFGVTLGAPYSEVVRWLPSMRPYPVPATRREFYSILYSITHLIYTLNDYSVRAVDPKCLGPEFNFLKTYLDKPIEFGDSETTGEFLDTLRAFGLTDQNPQMQKGVRFLLSTQNADGSWGKPGEKDIYTRYHSTWTAVDGLREYRFRPARTCKSYR